MESEALVTSIASLLIGLLALASIIARLFLRRLAARALATYGEKQRLWRLACVLSTGLSWSVLLAATSILVGALYLADQAGNSFATTLLTAFVAAFLVTVITETYKLSGAAFGKTVGDSLSLALPEGNSPLRQRFNQDKELLKSGSPRERNNALAKIFREAREAAQPNEPGRCA